MEAKTSNYLSVGIFVLVLVSALVVAMLWLLREGSDADRVVYEVYFNGSVSGLREGSQVRYRGVPVGVVKTIKIDSANVERIRVRIGIDEDTPIKEDAEASLEMQGLTGTAYVQISGGSQNNAALQAKSGERYPVIQSRSSRIEQVFESAPEMVTSLSALVHDVQKMFSPDNQKAVSELLQNFAEVSKVFSERSEDLKKLVTESASTAAQLTKVLTSVEGELGTLGKDTHQTIQVVQAMLEENRGSLKHFTGIGLDQLTKLIGDLRTTVAGMNRVVDHIERNPSRFFFGDGDGTVKPR